MKLPSDMQFSLSGTPIHNDTFNISIGWNMIGSISDRVNISEIESDPPGIVCSAFFEYTDSYSASPVIMPGKGYWVKVNQGGELILSSSGSGYSMNRIQIVPTGEQPPPPPDDIVLNSNKLIPMKYELGQNYPNPFNPTTVIQYQLPNADYVSLKLYNLLGEEVKTLVNEVQEAGYKLVQIDATGLSSGVYFYRLTAGSFVETRKLVLLR